MTPPFSMFHDGSELDIFPKRKEKYNKIDNIMKILDRESKRGGGWEKERSTNKVGVLYWLFW